MLQYVCSTVSIVRSPSVYPAVLLPPLHPPTMYIFAVALLLLSSLASAAPQSSDSANASAAAALTARGGNKCAYARSGLTPGLAFDKFVDTFYNKRDVLGAKAFLNADYINHNPYVPDGADAAINSLAASGYFNGTFGYMNVRGPNLLNPVGVVHYRYVYSDQYPTPTAVVDIFRMEGACVAEHWDVSQVLPSDVPNPHPLFSDPQAPKIRLPVF